MAKKTKETEKVRTLREQGVLNPDPHRVRDELFQDNDFFDPRDLVQVKYEMLRQVRQGASVSETARAFGLSRPTVYQAQRALEEAGMQGLLPKRPGPKRAHKLTQKLMAFLEQQRTKKPEQSSRELATKLQERFGVVVHPRSIERAMARQKKKHRQGRR